MRLQLVTYNMRKGKGVKPPRPSLSEIGHHLAALQPDLVLCQEVFHANHSEGPKQSLHLADEMELTHCYEANAIYKRGHHGNATFTRFPIAESWNQDISTNRIEQRGVLYTRLALPEERGALHVFNTHFGLSQRQRKLQARWVTSLMRRVAPPEDPVVLAGDFNDWSGFLDQLICREGDVDNGMLRLAMRDRKTWSTRRPLFALDRVYYRNLHVHEVRVLRDDPWPRLSDHFPVKAEIEILEPRPSRS